MHLGSILHLFLAESSSFDGWFQVIVIGGLWILYKSVLRPIMDGILYIEKEKARKKQIENAIKFEDWLDNLFRRKKPQNDLPYPPFRKTNVTPAERQAEKERQSRFEKFLYDLGSAKDKKSK